MRLFDNATPRSVPRTLHPAGHQPGLLYMLAAVQIAHHWVHHIRCCVFVSADPQQQNSGGRISGGRGLNFGSKLHVPKVTVDETAVESEDDDMHDVQRRGRWTFVDDADPVVSVIRSVKDLFPHVSVSCEPTTTLKLRKIFTPLKTVVTLGADYNTNIGVWQFRSSWEDSIIGGRISVAGREVMLSKSWLVKVMDSEDVATRQDL
jgi:hypothetical protein